MRVILALALGAAIASAQKVLTSNENILLQVATGKKVYLSEISDTGSATSDEIATLRHTAELSASISTAANTLSRSMSQSISRSISTAIDDSESTMTVRNAAHRTLLNQSLVRLMDSLGEGLTDQLTSTSAGQGLEISSLRSQLVAGTSCAVEGKLFNGSRCVPVPQLSVTLDTNVTMPNCTAALVGRSRVVRVSANASVIEVCVEPGSWNRMSQESPGSSEANPASSCAHTDQLGMESGTYWIAISERAVQVYCRNDIGGGGWALAMNIHNSDRHSSAWASTHPTFTPNGRNYVPANRQTYWLKDINYMPNGVGAPFAGDYKHQTVWRSYTPREIMVVRSNPRATSGEAMAYKVWSLTSRWRVPLLTTFRQTYRTQISTGAHTTAWTKPGQAGTNRFCPLMRYGGNLMTNWYYGNNGARFVLSGHPRGLSGQDVNDDATIGFGMEFSSHWGRTRLSGASGDWCFDTGIAECWSNGGSQRCPMGSDHCNSPFSNTDYGQYAFYVR